MIQTTRAQVMDCLGLPSVVWDDRNEFTYEWEWLKAIMIVGHHGQLATGGLPGIPLGNGIDLGVRSMRG